ncbi:MAG: glycosyltransferase family 9 protein [Burkholderiales bacterium]|nr:glycosyltransferase family 9 protein [Burkholderiales bacterium]
MSAPSAPLNAPRQALPHERQALWARARRILFVRLDNLGDVLMSSPAMAGVRQQRPDAHLALLCGGAGAAALPHLPMLDEAILYDAPWVQGAQPRDNDGSIDRRLVRRLMQGRFDAAVIFTVCTQSALPAALLLRQADIPLRLAHSRENPYDLLSDWIREPDAIVPGMRHEVQRQMDLVAAAGLAEPGPAGPLVFAVHDDDRRAAAAKLAQAGGRPDQPYVVLHPGATASSRRYPLEGYAAAVARLQQAGVQVVAVAGGSEGALVAELQAQVAQHGAGQGGQPLPALVGALTLGELGALIADAALLIGNNSAPAHLAAAVGTPVVVLYALTNPQHTPWQVPSRVLFHEVPCRDCLRSTCPMGHHDCLRQVPPQAVAQAAFELLQAAPSAPASRSGGSASRPASVPLSRSAGQPLAREALQP